MTLQNPCFADRSGSGLTREDCEVFAIVADQAIEEIRNLDTKRAVDTLSRLAFELRRAGNG